MSNSIQLPDKAFSLAFPFSIITKQKTRPLSKGRVKSRVTTLVPTFLTDCGLVSIATLADIGAYRQNLLRTHLQCHTVQSAAQRCTSRYSSCASHQPATLCQTLNKATLPINACYITFLVIIYG